MSGKPVERSLVALATIAPEFHGFAPADHRTRRIVEVLRRAVVRQRGPRDRAFYAMREVASFFGVSLYTVAEAYRQLEREGLLVRLRGSQTRIPATALRARHPVRGVVAVPVWTPGFVGFQGWRRFYRQLDDQLSRHGLVADLIFFDQGEELHREFSDRVLAHQPDVLVWLTPALTDRAVMRLIQDGGVRSVAIWPQHAPVANAAYRISYDRGLARAAAEWRAAGLRTVVLARPDYVGVDVGAEVIEAFTTAGLRCTYATPNHKSTGAFLRRLARLPRTGVVFHDGFWPEEAFHADAGALRELLTATRVAWMFHPGVLPASGPAPVIDVLQVDWTVVARRLATDLATGKAQTRTTPVTFEAVWRSRIPLTAGAALGSLR